MKAIRSLGAVLTLVLACSVSAGAQDSGDWRASSSEAKAITGDIGISDAKVFINFSGFTIAEIRAIKAAEASALFDVDSNAPGAGNLYRLNIPPSKRFLHHNTLCGTEETQWMVTWAWGPQLYVAFFSGPNMPVLTFEAMGSSTDHCGTFAYVR